jgi:hypothetical protein
VLDDEPVTLKTTSRPIVALPYNFEIHDIVMMALQHHASDVWYSRAMDHFECSTKKASSVPRSWRSPVTPICRGAHRIRHVERAFRTLLDRRGVVAGRCPHPRLASRPAARELKIIHAGGLDFVE